MDFKAEPKTIDDVLTLKRKYIIPRFQREYSWENEELITLWDDLIDNLIFNKNEKEIQVNEYFIGSLVLIGDEDDPTNIERAIVDGQQRLITFTIIFSVLAQIFKAQNELKLADVVHSNIIGEDNNGKKLTKVEAETPKPFFQYRIQMKDIDFTQIPKSNEEKRILNAYNFFAKKLEYENYIKDLENKFNIKEMNYIEILKIFRDQVLNCKVVYVTVKSFEDAYMIFEVLNAKGKNLSPVDIIKNSLFSILTDNAPLDDAFVRWEKIRKNINSSKNDELLMFYRHFWLSKHKFSTNKKLVNDFNKEIKRTKKEYKNFLTDLEKASIDYVKISNPKISDWVQTEKIKIFYYLDAYKTFGVTQIRSLLLSLMEIRLKRKISHKLFLEILDFLEYFHFIFTAICSSRPSGLERKYSKFAIKFKECKDNNDCRCITKKLKADFMELLPDFETFSNSIKNIQYTSDNDNDKKIVQYILQKIETHLTSYGVGMPVIFTIEHILPESTKKAYVGFLGNLLPLEDKLNSDLKDKNFEYKIKKYPESQFKSVKNFVKKYEESSNWNEKEIISRTKEISSLLYYDIWRYSKK